MAPQIMRVATAVDVHAFEPESYPESGVASGRAQSVATEPHTLLQRRPLMLACLEWPGERALAGHSDGDVAAHAACDAILIAAGVGEMGTVFGVDRPEFAGASGEMFLREALRLARGAGFGVTNISVQIVAQQPRFSPRKAAAEERMSAIVGAPVAVAATTTDHLGFIGAGEGIAAIATALLHGI